MIKVFVRVHKFYFESCDRKRLCDAVRNLTVVHRLPGLTNHRLFEQETWDRGVTEEGELFSATRRNISNRRKEVISGRRFWNHPFDFSPLISTL